MRALRLLVLVLALAGPAVSPAFALAPAEPEKKPATFRDELRLFSYLETSYTWNLTGAGRGGVNEQRVYDYDEGFTFNMAEFSRTTLAAEATGGREEKDATLVALDTSARSASATTRRAASSPPRARWTRSR